jgi:hypothetical protein
VHQPCTKRLGGAASCADPGGQPQDREKQHEDGGASSAIGCRPVAAGRMRSVESRETP